MAAPLEIQLGRITRFLQKLTGIKGVLRHTLSTELTPQIEIRSGVENRYLEGWNRFSVTYNVAALAAVTGAARLRNPLTSGVIAVIEKLNWFPVATIDTAQLEEATTNADLTVGTSNALDPRGNPGSALIVSQNSTGVHLATLIGFFTAPAARTKDEWINTDNQEIPLLPGQAIQVIDTSVNSQFIVNIVWRERILEDSEKA